MQSKNHAMSGPGWRHPEISAETAALAASLFFAATSNVALWRAVAATGLLADAGGWRTAAALLVATVAIHAMFFGMVFFRRTTKPLLAILLLLTAATSHFSSAYAVYMDPSMMRNVLRTDVAEAQELLTPGLLWAIAFKGLLPLALLCMIRMRPLDPQRGWLRRIRFLAVMFGLVVVAIALSFQGLSSLMRNHQSMRYLIAPGNYMVAMVRVMQEGAGRHRGPRTVVAADARLATHPPGAKPHLLVIVVGETARARNWGLNGYSRQTTPQLARLDVVNYRNGVACGTDTETAVPCMFSVQGRRRYDREIIRRSESLLHVLERAGVRTLWRDNQTGCKGVCEGLAFESYRKPTQGRPCEGGECRDAAMLDGLHDAIERHPGDTVVVLHQIGNHGPSYFRRYPPEFRRFVPDCNSPDLGDCTREEIVNAYDNAILATDDFLAKAIRMLQADASHDTALIYMSDHGESLGENNLYLHGIPYAIAPDTQTRVPMLAWLSPGMKRHLGMDMRCLSQRSTMPVGHDHLFHSVLGLMQVKTGIYEPGLDLFAACIRPPAAPLRKMGSDE